MNELIFISLPKNELENLISTSIKKALEAKSLENRKEIFSSKELCAWLSISQSTLAKWKREHRIPYSRNGKRIFFERGKVLESLKESNYSKIKQLGA